MVDDDTATPRRVLADGRAFSVLLVDDQRIVGIALERLLASEQDIKLHCCYTALDAVARANELVPTVILQDLVLPDVHGLTLVRMFRANPSTAATPIVVLSGNDDAVTRTRALSEGASDYLVKLPSKVDLVACIRRHAGSAGETAAAEPVAAPAAAAAASGERATDILDRRFLLEIRRANTPGAADFAVMLIDDFTKEAASQLERLRDARRRQDMPALKATLHGLKGASMTMGARRLACVCAQMEDHVDRGSKGVVLSTLMSEIAQELITVRHALAGERQGCQSPITSVEPSCAQVADKG